MTPIEIAYFKHFLFDKSLERSFNYYYKTRRIKGSPSGDKDGNPEKIEEYFLKTTVEDVIMKAFYFAPTNNNAQRITVTYDYWKDIDDKWQEYMKQNESNFSNDSWPMLRKSFAILRQNWDIPYYWKHENLESTEEVYERMHIDMPLPEFRWEHGYTKREERPDTNLIGYDIHNAKDGDFVVRTRTLKGGGIGRTIFIMKEVVPYDPETSEFTPEQLHCDYDSEKGNVHIAYLHARYNSMGGSFSTDYADDLHAVIDDSSTTEKYRLAFKEEEQTMILKLAENQLAWNPATKTIVPLLEALEAKNEKPADTPLIDFSATEGQDDGLEIDFIDFDSPRRTLYTLHKGVISVNTRSGSGRITFNRADTKELQKKNFKYARVGKLKDGSVVMMLNNQKGINLVTNAEGYYNINSKQFVETTLGLLGINKEGVLVYLRIETISDKPDSVTIKLIKQ